MARHKPTGDRARQLLEWLRTYQDLERTLRDLKRAAEGRARQYGLQQIDLKTLIQRVSASKKRLERKIGNTLLLERDHLKQRLSHLLKTGDRDDLTPG